MPPNDWMLIGRVAGPFGVRGEMKVELETDFPDRFKGLSRIFLGEDHVPHAVAGSRKHKGQVLLRLEGIDSPEAVRELRRREIFVPRSEAAPLPEGHFFLDDVMGMDVVTTDGREVGVVRDVLQTGSNEVFVVRGGTGEVLIPAIKDAVHEMDMSSRRICVEPWALGETE